MDGLVDTGKLKAEEGEKSRIIKCLRAQDIHQVARDRCRTKQRPNVPLLVSCRKQTVPLGNKLEDPQKRQDERPGQMRPGRTGTCRDIS